MRVPRVNPSSQRCVNNPNLFVISGGPGSGKTTILRELAGAGYPHAPEVARQIIQEQVQSGGTALPWADRKAYTQLMLERSLESYFEHRFAPGPTFFDRGIPDTLGYARLIGLRETESIERACRCYRYAPVVFLAPPWEEIYAIDSERKPDYAEAKRTFAQLADTYQECGYEVLEIPKLTPPARVRFILEHLNLSSAGAPRR